MLGDKTIRSVKLYKMKESTVEVVFAAFEDSDWAGSIPSPFSAKIDPQYVHRAVRLANKGLNGIRLEVRRGGDEIAWNYTNCR